LWGKLHNEELHDLYNLSHYCLGNEIEKNKMGGACSSDGDGRGVHRDLVGKPVGKRPLGRPIGRWDDNIKVDLQEVGLSWLKIETGGGHL
jgi:hypothetical protein